MNLRKTLTALLLTLPFFLFSQEVNIEHLKGMKIRNIGPAGMSGRVTSIDVDLSNDDIIYAGTASGGLWKSTSGGVSWKSIFDDQPTQSIGAVTVNQNNPSEIWVGTGEGNPRNSHNEGEGIYKSIDGGETWHYMGLKETKVIHRIIIHRDNPDIVYVGASGTAWGTNPERGVFRTKDGGKTWEKILYSNEGTGIADLVVDPTNPNKLIAAMWEHERKPWTFNSGGENSGIYVTHDGGDTWERRTSKDGLPKGNLGRIGLAIAPSSPNIVYAIVEAKENNLYKSTDGGKKWRKMPAKDNVSNRPFYYHDIYVDPMNENRIFSIWSTMSKSEDGGKSFQSWVGWKVHPDHHAFWIHPTNPKYMIEGNDGGMNISRDGGKTWRFVENLPLAQFYHINYDMDIPYNIGGGMQDNGSWIGPSAVWQSGGIRNFHWEEIYFGDGFDVGIRPDNNRYAYAMSQGGNLGYIDRETGKTNFIKPVHPDGETKLRWHWNAAFAQSPQHNCGIYYGSQFVHKSMDCGKSWEIISPDLTTNDTLKQKQNESGGLTIDDTNAENHTTIIAISPSPVNENVIWVGTDDGNVQVTQDGGKTWSNVASRMSGVKAGSWIPQIEVSQTNAGEAFVIVNDYRRNDWRPMAYHTTDYGVTFKRIVDENKVTGHALAIVQDPSAPNLLWLGTDYGLYFTIDGGNNWSKWTNNYPSVSTRDLKIHPREKDLIVGTFGRAAWILDDTRPIREIAKTNGKVLDKPFAVFEAPDAYLAERRSVDGVRFAGDALFQGPNRTPMAMISMWVKPPSKKKKPIMGEEAPKEETKKKKKGKKSGKDEAQTEKSKDEKPKEGGGKRGGGKKKKVKVQVMDSQGDTIRTFSSEVDTGLVRIYWNLRHDGISYPSRRAPRPGADKPSGYSVLPGTYKLVMTYGDHKDSTTVTVHPDPRIPFSMADAQAEQAALDDFYKLVNTATAAWNQLGDAKKIIKRVDGALVNAPDSLKKEVADLGKALKDSISTFENIYMDPPNQKGIQRNPNTMMGTLFGASRYIGNSDGAPSPSAQVLIKKARKEVTQTVKKINAFFENDFAAYRKKVEAVQYSLFKDFEPVKME